MRRPPLESKEDTTLVAGAFLVIMGVTLHSAFMLAFGAVLVGFAILANITYGN